MPELVGLALACGASDIGGAFSRSEVALINRALPASTANARRVRAAIRDGSDPFGDALCALRSPDERRSLGAFYTPPEIVLPMVSWVFEQRPQRLIDPGCGSGRFSVAATKWNRSINILAIDLDPVATILTRAALAAVGARNPRVLQADYLTVNIPRITARTAFVSNPPYVRHHGLDANTKARALALATKAGYRISGLAGLHALFYLVTLAKHGRRGDVGSFITSAEWLDVGYGSVIRNMFTKGLGGRSLAVYDPEAVPFKDAMTTAAITTFCIGEETNVTRLQPIIDTTRPLLLEDVGYDIERTALAHSPRWSPFLRNIKGEVPEKTIGEIFRVSRGQVTGANKYFVMTRRQAREYGIEPFCIPVVSSARELFSANGVVRDTPERMVGLAVPADLNVAEHPQLAAYLHSGKSAGIHQGYVASRRRPWYAVTYPRPPVVATYMARQAPVFARNPDGLGLLNIAHGLHPRRPLEPVVLDRIVAALNATRTTFIGRGRTYHGGLEKFEPREMEALPLEVIM